MTFDELSQSDRRRCFDLDKTQPDPSNPNRFLVCLVFENEPRRFPMSGRGELASPWYWDEDTVKLMNERRFGLDANAAYLIVCSSMTAGFDHAKR